jgi:hypothetical protein
MVNGYLPQPAKQEFFAGCSVNNGFFCPFWSDRHKA